MKMVGPEVAEQNQGDHSQETGMCGEALANGMRRTMVEGEQGLWELRGEGHKTHPG